MVASKRRYAPYHLRSEPLSRKVIAMTIEAIKEAIADLPPDEKTRLAAWVLQQDLEEWDRQIQDDFSPGGRGMAMLEEAQADAREGRSKPLDGFLAETRARRSLPNSKP